jgi:GTP-binding protein LepA
MALENDLEIVPVINKIDLPSADPDRVKEEIENSIGLDTENAVLASAKTGIGIEEILDAIVEYIPAPGGDEEAPLQALIFDSYYDNYRGAISSVRVKAGSVKVGDRIRMMAGKCEFDVTEVGTYLPLGYSPKDELCAGEVGYIAASIKDIADIHVGDTITLRPRSAEMDMFKVLREGTSVMTPKWLSFDAPNLTGSVNAMPAREDIDLQLQENMIVEYYSR